MEKGRVDEAIIGGAEAGIRRRLQECACCFGQYPQGMRRGISEGVAEMCNLSEGIYRDGVEAGVAQGVAQGMEQGKKESVKDMVLSLLNENMPLDFIMRVTKLPAERVREIAAPHGYVI